MAFNLSQKERDILACVALAPDKPIEQVRRETGYRDHTIRYALTRLQERGIIKRLPFFNLNAEGYVLYNIFFSTGAQSKKVKDELFRFLTADRKVTWFAQLSAEFPYGLGICAKHIQAVGQIINQLSKRFPGVFYEKAVSAQLSSILIPPKFLSAKRFKAEPLSSDDFIPNHKVDSIDARILSALANIEHRSHRELAQKLGMPLSTLELRIKKLEKSKVIVGYWYSIDATKFGMQFYKMVVYARGLSHELSQKIYNFALNHRSAIYFIECLGNWDYEINFVVENPEQMVTCTQELYDACGQGISDVKVLSVFRALKISMYPDRPSGSAQG